MYESEKKNAESPFGSSIETVVSAPVQPGNSGGPLLDNAGNVVGVIVSKLNVLKMAAAMQDIPQNINFAIKSRVALLFLNTTSALLSDNSSLEAMAAPEVAKIATNIGVLIECN